MARREGTLENVVIESLEFFKKRRVLITGHTGFKGTWLTRILLLAGAEIIGYSLDPPTCPSLYALTDTGSRIRSIHGDVRSFGSLNETLYDFKPEIVFHLAAQPIVRLSYDEPMDTYSTNVMGTVHILEAIRKSSSVRSFVNITTDKVYENREWIWGYRENETLCGFDPYSNSKSCSEMVTSSYRNSFFSDPDSTAISTARSGNVIGGGDFAQDRIIPDCVRAIAAGRELLLRNPHSIRPYQHVLECLSGYLLLAMKQFEEKSYEGPYNFGPDEDGCVSTGTLVQMVFKEWGAGTWRIQGDGGPHEASFLKLDCSKAKNILEWRPKWNIQQAVAKTLIWTQGYLSGENVDDLTDRQIMDYFNI
ncbi:MAG: CDP-glucose 4,6-dehydratase [Spirochaetae bacterium HGW-Spirochaetae-4]|nr:MAG: CDP-glucose 4,6-dehydratase [Spirochaetae bacterium HGW-Spirochaetae-4]